jgi:hypothetical protein
MKKTVEELKQIIKEELQRILVEQETPPPIDFSSLAADPDPGEMDSLGLEENEELYYEYLD